MKKNIPQTVQASFREQKERPTKALPATSVQIRIPTQRPIPQFNHHIKRETRQVTKEWTAEVSHTDQLTAHLPLSSKAAPNLALKCIQRFHQKKTSSLLKKMVERHELASRKVDKSSTQQQLEKNQDELWRDMIKSHEERHFQIDRITKLHYFN